MDKQSLHLSQFKAAIFDMDGTMIDNSAFHKKAFQEFNKRHGIILTEQEYQKKISGKKNDQIFNALFNRELSRELYVNDIKEVEGLIELIRELQKKGLKLAIATTAPKENRDFAFENLGLSNEFVAIVGDEHVTNGKPHPEVYLKAAEKLNLDPKECIAFEDTPSGVESAKRAGMTV